MSVVEDRLRELGLALPPAKSPVANYLGTKRSGDHPNPYSYLSALMIAPIRYGLLTVAVVGSFALGRATPQTSREAAAVRSARSAQNTAIAARDFDRAATYWTDDVVIRSGLGRVVQGRADYRAAMAADSATVFRREPDRVDVSGNDRWPLAFESGTWTGARDGRQLIRGRYAAQWIKRDGRWLIRAEVFVALGCAGEGCSRPLTVQ